MPRLRRHHCGVKIQRDRDRIFERAKFNHNTTFAEAGQHVEEMCTRFHGITEHNLWHLQYAADYSRTGLETKSLRSSLFTVSHFQSAMESSHFSNIDSMVNCTTIPIILGSESSRSGKRKFLFTDDARSVRPCTLCRQTRIARRLGGSRVDSVAQLLISAPLSPVCEWLHHSDGIILPLHRNALCPMHNEFSRQSRERSSTSPFVTWRLLESGVFFGLSNNSPASQINGLSSATGFECRALHGEYFVHSSFTETSRESYSESNVGAYARRFYMNGAETSSANHRMLNSFDPSRRFMFYRAGRDSPFRESVSRSSQSIPLEAPETLSRLIPEPEVALVGNYSPYVSVRGQGASSSISYYNENGYVTPRSAPSRRPRRRWRQRIIGQQRASHESLNQSLEDEEVDIDSPHSDMDTDVDEMSYEELLVLEERIGNVETGLSEDSIQKCVKTGKHCALSGASSATYQKNEVLCSICQEEFRESDELGLLVCGHSHHPACIKQWLRLKNQCPICKAAAYLEC